MQTTTMQHIPQSKPNQQNTGLLYINHEIPRIMTLDELSKHIIYLGQIYQYSVHNNVSTIITRK